MNKMKNLSFVLIAIIGLSAAPALAQNISTPYVSTTPIAPACVSLTASMSKGKHDASTNGDVTRLQNFLNKHGYLPVAATGYFGPLTAKAVMTFQKENGLTADGIVGPMTRSYVFAKDCAGTPISTPTISAITPNQGKEGTVVTLTGSGFIADSIVHIGIGGIKLAVTGNGTMASFTVPSYVGQYCKPGMACIMIAQALNAGTYQLSVENANGISNAVPFVITTNPTS
jgi:peptidoglycan hydrolase-like protein with peptidoglycan-binding domain